MRRKLAVILCADIAGYSRLIAEDDEGTVARFSDLSSRFQELVSQHQGRVFNMAGDAILAEFDSAVSAIRCALDVQELTASEARSHPEKPAMAFRIGIAMGDVIVTSTGDLLGDGVNIAARLQTLSDVGGICVSRDIQALAVGKVGIRFVGIGTHVLKNISAPVEAYKIGDMGAVEARPAEGFPWLRLGRRTRWSAIALAGALSCAGGYLAIRGFAGRPQRPLIASAVPFISDRARVDLASYADFPAYKAVALARDGLGVASAAQTAEEAKDRAFRECQSRAVARCSIYAVGDEVIWDRQPPPMPSASEIRMGDAGPLNVGSLPSQPGETIDRLRATYVPGPPYKAMALGPSGQLGWAFGAGSTAEAVRRALERCGDLSAEPCSLIALGDRLTQPLPTSHPVIGSFVPSRSERIRNQDRAQIAARYADRDWRAVAVDSDGRAFAVSGQRDELQASEAALAACREQSPTCRLIAIGDFAVTSD
jgi:adenylate cyclase